jgi:DNA-binding NtrC family response regulator
MQNYKILIVDNDKNMVEVIASTIENENYDIIRTHSGADAVGLIQKIRPDLVITDLKMSDIDGIAVLKEAKKSDPEVVVIIVTAFASVETALHAMKEGAYDYVIKPFKLDELRMVVSRGLDLRNIKAENVYLKKELAQRYGFENIVGNSPQMQKLFDTIRKVADVDTTVLIAGESGTGKELVARAVHFNSPRKGRPFVAINCGALPEGILESELFGHVKGAYTGAVSTKPGLFQEADQGTLFLDEIGLTTPAIQVSLLRVLQDRVIRMVGDSKSIKVDVRIIAATNEDLEAKVKDGSFREDLFYRLSVIPVTIPPLRERTDDIPLLIKHIIDKMCAKQGTAKRVSDEAVQVLCGYNWPGNVRELENVIERAVSLSETDIISPKDLPEKVRSYAGGGENAISGKKLEDYMAAAEKVHIEKVLRDVEWNKKLAAEVLGISLASLYRKIEELGVKC